jgi:hypothetical protein
MRRGRSRVGRLCGSRCASRLRLRCSLASSAAVRCRQPPQTICSGDPPARSAAVASRNPQSRTVARRTNHAFALPPTVGSTRHALLRGVRRRAAGHVRQACGADEAERATKLGSAETPVNGAAAGRPQANRLRRAPAKHGARRSQRASQPKARSAAWFAVGALPRAVTLRWLAVGNRRK